MEQITFEKLQKLVANIDYVFDDSYPVCFDVNNNGKKIKFECGITNAFEFEGQFYDGYQYFMVERVLPSGRKITHFFDLQDPDGMTFDEIGNMLKTHCEIDDNSIIRLFAKSFSGKRKNIDTDKLPLKFEAEERRLTYELELTEEVSKGIEWFRKITGEDNVLVSTKPGEFVDLNNMDGSSFAFMFDTKVLYYDTFTSAICTYYPKHVIRTKEYKSYKRLESNDKFKWILLYICNGEDLLSSTKVCFVRVDDEYGESAYYEDINNEKVNNWFKETFTKALEMSKSNAI